MLSLFNLNPEGSMNRKMYIGVDVDDQAFHACAITEGSKEEHQFACKPNIGELVKKLQKIKAQYPNLEINICYEATYLGFSLYRDLKERGWKCEVIAPSLIPTKAGRKVKTDKLDSRKLARYYMKDELTSVHIPSKKEEAIRDFIRSRRFFKNQLKRLKLHLLSTCRRMGISYKDTGSKSYWTIKHLNWLNSQIGHFTDPSFQMNMTILIDQINHLVNQIHLYDEQIEQIEQISKTELYARQVKALTCYRGIDTLTAMTLITEFHDIRRFDHPRRLTSYAGMDLQEYSSGGKEIRLRITKMGNKHIRTSVIEACQLASSLPRVSRRLLEKRKGVDRRYIEIADRCMNRLYKKSGRLTRRGKMHNKIKVACAREMLGFIWESLWAAAA